MSHYPLSCTILALAFTALTTAAAAQTTLILSHHVPETHVIHQTAQRFADAVHEGTNGEVEIVLRPAGQMFGMEQGVEALDLGTLDFAWSNVSALQRWVPATGFLSMPFLFEDGDHAKAVLYGDLGERVRTDVLDRSNVDILAFGNAGFRVFVTKRPVNTAADVAGMKIRVPNIAAFVDLVRSLDANPTPMSATEVYTALQTGVIDGMESPADYFQSVSIWEVVDHAARTNHIFTAGAIMASKATMSDLSESQQQIVRAAAKEAVGDWMWSNVEGTQNDAWATMEANMTAVAEPDRASFQEATSGMIDAFISSAGPLAEEYIGIVRATR